MKLDFKGNGASYTTASLTLNPRSPRRVKTSILRVQLSDWKVHENLVSLLWTQRCGQLAKVLHLLSDFRSSSHSPWNRLSSGMYKHESISPMFWLKAASSAGNIRGRVFTLFFSFLFFLYFSSLLELNMGYYSEDEKLGIKHFFLLMHP